MVKQVNILVKQIKYLLINTVRKDNKELVMKRFGQIVGIKKDKLEEYKKYHSDVWPGVLAKIKDCNIRNYSIFLFEDKLFAYFEYIGTDFEADMAKMAADETTRKWWDIMIPMQNPIYGDGDAQCITLEEVFHVD